ncbi:response regulator transcription factor [Thiohalocapsa marina]|uniref:Response regulator transcription factor n=1 Tax=Thiohalocapsa marina TaxID=424902 RepID=A0A5M8FT50_9GAMM|nr:response regulator transcription factor [Thiohalocapsa marina]KAA6186969.1 response regulator transcription factor [Thiohalocapsa marina]
MKIKVLLVDDHRMVRDGLGALLAQEADIEVVAFASDGEEAVTLAHAWKPDVVLMDICMPRLSGIDAAAQIVKSLPKTRVIALSAQGEWPFVSQMMAAGVCGYVQKEQSVTELAATIRAAMAGEMRLPELPPPTRLANGTEKRSLSRRERLVLKELGAGKPAREVAQAMGISTKTVDTYRRRMMIKLGLQCQTELMKYAVTLHGAGDLPATQE